MFKLRRIVARAGWLAGAVALVTGSLATAQAQTAAPLARPAFSVLHAFDDTGGEFSYPDAVIPSGDGGYVGTLVYGGAFGSGMVYKLAADGSETTIHDFTGDADGGIPAGVIADAQGNLYGVAAQGGNPGCTFGSCGVIYEVTPDGQETVLYAFPASMTMGWFPTGQLTRDPAGNLYGATMLGGDTTCPGGGTAGCGVVFKLAPDGSYTVLHTSTGGADGVGSYGNLLRDRAGNLYGITNDNAPWAAGACQTPDASCGTVFRIAPDGTYTQLHVFGGFADGLRPTAGLARDAEGNLYGTTTQGGVNPGNLCPADPPYWDARGGCGVVFKLTPGGVYSVLYAFQGGNDGISPEGSLYRDPKGGGLYGTASTFLGRYCEHHLNCGLVFEVMPDGSKRTEYNFASSDSLEPIAPVVKGYGAQLIGIAAQGKNHSATVYRLQFGGGQ